MTEPDQVNALRAKLDKASECLGRVCREQAFKLTACVPARPGVDDDLVLGDGIQAGLAACAALRDLREECDALLADLMNSYDDLQAVDTFRDWPADTVLGGNGVDAIAELEAARATIGGRIANYHGRDEARARHEAKRRRRREELVERLAKRRQEAAAIAADPRA